MMKRIVVLTISILLVVFSCDKNEERIVPKPTFDALDGFTVGVIRLTFADTPEGDAIAVERREKGTQEWQYIGSCGNSFFDDNYGYTQDDEIVGMPPKVFEYRARNSRYEYGDLEERGGEEYSEIQEGFAYNIIPITEINIEKGLKSNHLTWNAGNNESFLNQSTIYFNVFRSEDSLGTYTKIAQVDKDRSYFDDFTFKPELQGKKLYYRVDVFYDFEIIMSTGGNHFESTTPVEGTIVAASVNSGGNPTVDYTINELGQVVLASQGGIPTLLEKNVNGTLYLGLINNAGATGYGTPELYKLNGTTWQREWSNNPSNEFDNINYAIASSSQYVAGIQDSLCVYEWNGSSWGNNLAPNNLGKSESPSTVSLAVDNDNLYMAITQYPDYDLQVLKHNGSGWDTIGGDAYGIIASGTISDITLEKIGNGIYLHYLIDNILNIKHLSGDSWVTDLIWTKDNITDVDIAMGSSGLYFISGSTNSTYRGGVYKITSTSTAEEIISNSTDDWFQFPLSISIDSDDNLIVVSMKYNESTTSFYPYLNLHDGTDWKTISGDFSDGIDPAVVSAQGTDLIYVYGDGASENASGDPTIIKSKKMTKK